MLLLLSVVAKALPPPDSLVVVGWAVLSSVEPSGLEVVVSVEDPEEDPDVLDGLGLVEDPDEPLDVPSHVKLLPSLAFSSSTQALLNLITLSEVTEPSSVPRRP